MMWWSQGDRSGLEAGCSSLYCFALKETTGSLNSSNMGPCMSKNNSEKMPNEAESRVEYPLPYTLPVLKLSYNS
ncbi:hypothetical protein TNCV_1887251 [Trichonephila clavipes]|nr:hypothetical protein TNCV_1887251 [Trichonephila clavipes]